MVDCYSPGHRPAKALRELLAVLDGEVAQSLTVNGVFDVLAYGWLDYDRPDPEYRGLAIWQTSAPFEPDWAALLNGGTVAYVPTALDETLTRTGEDFIGTMKFAQRSIGMAFCCAANTDPANLDTMDAFWYEYTTSIQWLNIASDRLRQFFKAAFPTTGKRRNGQRRERSYCAPFKENNPVDQHAGELMSFLLPIVNELQKHQKERDRIVHEVATSTAKRAIDILKEQREHATTGKPVETADISFEDLQSATLVNPSNEATNVAVQNMKTWYERLVQASNIVFELEHSSRANRGR